MKVSGVALVALVLCSIAIPAQDRAPRVYKDHVTPHWFAGGEKFWYRNELRGGGEEYVVVDAVRGTREVVGKPPELAEDGEGLPAEKQIRPSTRNGVETSIAFQNRREDPVELLWIDTSGERHSYGKIGPSERRDLRTFDGHVWAIVSTNGQTLGVFEATEDSSLAVIDDALPGRARERVRRGRRQASRDDSANAISPDGKWRVEIRDYNVFIRSLTEEKEVQLSRDGKDGLAYDRPVWAPDSRSLVAFRVEPGERKPVYLVESSPADGGRARLQTRNYALPGDKFTRYELNLFDIGSGKQIKPEVDRFEHEWERPRVHWQRNGSQLAYQQVDRGHQRFRVIQFDARDGTVRNLVDERSKTFIWTAHTEALGLDLVNWMPQTDEIIYASERSGWRHLYLVNAVDGTMRPITSGRWIIRGIEKIDEGERQIWFRASGVFPGQDPYLVHFGRVNFDGTGLVFLTEADGNHTIQFSPDRRFIIDTYSRVDAAPGVELRRVSDGKFICKLEQADTSELEARNWRAPEVFVAKGRDGETDIYGIICRPADFDPSRKYPVLEDIYAGPHGSFVPKTFSARPRYEEYTKLGFIVVKIDGMGTANRSKGFQDVCWQNLKDGGFEDRILWMKAAARKFRYMDIERVGIFGTSAGGQNAAAAVLFHPEFYKAAAANCGCHDNRMDKASWNEQWMGYPVRPQYSECSNIDNAGKLGGALFLIVGELDRNVPPESTLRFADALIKANKDFEFLIVPGADHGTGGPAARYVQRRTQDFFVRKLQMK